ncbi:MAG: sugar ABC transporter permease [Rhodothermales bacterium]|nr:sugar ABC transporter permease [Rhodothermales bacterium]MCA0269260.1 sugar ABC transporter permease [Bacteroidota bacterium]
MARPQSKKFAGMIGSYAVIALFAFIAVYPILYIFTISLRPGDQLLSTSLQVIPDGATLNNYRELLTETPFLRWMANSLFVSAVVTISGVALASTAGYAISRYKFKGRRAMLKGLLVTQMFPATMLLLPLYVVLINLQLLNSYLGILVIYSATALPFCVWQMKGYYDTIPAALEEAARIDGCTPWQAFRLVILPLAAPALVITALFSFMSAWNEYVVANVVLQDVNMFTLPLGLKMFQGSMTTQWGLYAAGALLVSVPVVLLFLGLSRYLISGLTLGGVKG